MYSACCRTRVLPSPTRGRSRLGAALRRGSGWSCGREGCRYACLNESRGRTADRGLRLMVHQGRPPRSCFPPPPVFAPDL
eukprot:389078-Prymnesium_polylepis.2